MVACLSAQYYPNYLFLIVAQLLKKFIKLELCLFSIIDRMGNYITIKTI